MAYRGARTGKASAAIGLVLAGALSAYCAPAATMIAYDIPSQDLGTALDRFAEQSGQRTMAASALLAGKRSTEVKGVLPAREALDRLLTGTGLQAHLVAGTYVIRASNDAPSIEADRPQDITVTGTRIRGAAPIGSPLTVITRDELEKSGRATVADMLQTLPQNFTGGPNEGSVGTGSRNGTNRNSGYGASVNLRGLGTQSTLVLFDGNRPALGGLDGAFADLSLIPSTAIDRIEILSDGASAIYGTDAVAGVVNVRFRDALEGIEAKAYSGVGDDYNQRQLAFAAGHRWATGHVILAYQFDEHSRLSGADRSYITSDLRAHGATDDRLLYATPGNIRASNGTIYAIPSGLTGPLTAGELTPGTSNFYDQARSTDLLPSQRTHSVYGSGEQQISPGLVAYAHLLYAHRTYARSLLNTDFASFTIPTSNPFYVDPIGSRQPVSVLTNFAGLLGAYGHAGSVTGTSVGGGLKGRLASWTIEAAGSWGRQVERDHAVNAFNAARVNQALADTDPATALNLFGGTNAPATLESIRGFDRNYNRYTVWNTTFRTDGNVIALPAGMAKLALGAEHRSESFNSFDVYSLRSTAITRFQNQGTPASRHIDALYAELSLPLLTAGNGVFPGRLDATAAGRVDWYSDVGRTVNPKFGLRWEPSPDLALRGSYATSFRAPSFTENSGTATNSAFTAVLADPRSPTGQTNVIELSGNVDPLKPEKAKSWTVGLDIHPRPLPGLSLSATYFNVNYRDRIATPASDVAKFLTQRDVYGSLIQDNPSAATVAALASGRYFFNLVGIPLNAVGAIVDLRHRNLSRQYVQGVDLDLRYRHGLFGGEAGLQLSATRLIGFDSKITASAPSVENLATFGYPVRLKLRQQSSWEKNGLSLSVAVNHSSGYINIPTDYYGTALGTVEHVKGFTTIDGDVGYHFSNASPLRGATISLSALNLLNQRPPYLTNVFFNNVLPYDPGQASPIGRLIAVQLKVSL